MPLFSTDSENTASLKIIKFSGRNFCWRSFQ